MVHTLSRDTMKPMNDTAQQPPKASSNPQQQGAVGFAKETEPIVESVSSENPPLTEIGRDIELSPEVTAAGVSVHPTVIAIPKPIEASGVEQAGANITAGTGESIKLPLTDKEIADGFKQPKSSSWYFLSTWCKYQLQKFGLAIRNIGGKTGEVKTP